MEINAIIKEFEKRFGEGGEIRIFKSPGRVNLIGEHTDYNGGCVFPAAICLETTIAARVRKDRRIRMAATDLDVLVDADIDKIEDYKDLKWGNYQLGIASELMKDGYDVQGCDMLFDDTTPHGGGLSSSAAIEVATALCLATFANEAAGKDEKVDMIKMALISQKAEHNYIGVSCGIMDQFASAMGKKDHAIFLNCADLSYKHVPLNIEGKSIVIANTNKKRSLITSKYNERCEECAEALSAFKTILPNIVCLADVSVTDFEDHEHIIENETVRKRAKHVIYECDRVLKSVEALNRGDIEEFGRLMNRSHDSLRDLYEVTGPELDTLVSEARKIDGCIGSRMTGAGFGGCSVSIVENGAVEEFKEKVGKAYTEKIGYAPSFYITGAGDGGREIKL